MEPIEHLFKVLAQYGINDRALLQKLGPLLKTLSLDAGHILVRAGEKTRSVYFLSEGWIKYFYSDENGKEYVRYFCTGGNFVTSHTALVQGTPSSYSICTLSPVRVVEFSWDVWRQHREQWPALKTVEDHLLVQALARLEERERSLMLDDAMTRYLSLLEEFPGIEEHVHQYDIAAWLGVSPISLSRLRGQKVPVGK